MLLKQWDLCSCQHKVKKTIYNCILNISKATMRVINLGYLTAVSKKRLELCS